MSNYRRSFRKIISERFAEVPEFNTGTSSGYIGSQGDIGYTGSKGDQGIQGPIGYTGSAGITPEGGSSVTVSATSPVSVSEGDLWFDSENLETYVYYSNNWVVANPTVSNPTTGGATALEVYANSNLLPATNNTDGDLAFVQDTKSLYIWNGSEWNRVYTSNDSEIIWTTEPSIEYNVETGVPETIQVSATDPEGFGITYSYNTSPPDVTAYANISQTNNSFEISATDINQIGNKFLFRVNASDGLKTSSRTSTITIINGNDSISNAIANGATLGSVVNWKIANGVYKDAYLSTDGWVLYSSFSSDNSLDSTNYPALNGNRILIPDFATYGYEWSTNNTPTDWDDGVNGGGPTYPRKSGFIYWYGSSSSLGEFQTSSWNGPLTTTNVRVVWGIGTTNTSVSNDSYLYVNESLVRVAPDKTTLTNDVAFNVNGTTPLIRIKEANGSIAGISQIWIKF